MGINRKLVQGLQLGRGDKDWQAGANSPIVRKILEQKGDWTNILIPHETQFIRAGYTDAYDSLMCVAFTLTDAIEYILTLQMTLNMISSDNLAWLRENGYMLNGFVNFNERFTGVVGGTTEKGAYLYKVADGMRTEGLIPQAMFPFAQTFAENIDPKFITLQMRLLGKEFARRFKINYEWVAKENTAEFLKYSPLASVGYFGNMIGDEPIAPKGNFKHSVLQIKETETYRKVDDSYWQQFKKYKKFALNSFMAFYVDASDKTMIEVQTFLDAHDEYLIRNTNTGEYGVIYGKTPMRISEERAGLFMIDRSARELVNSNKTTFLSAEEWDQLDWSKLF